MTTIVTSDWLLSGVMTILLWLKLSWRDHRLAWEPARYEGVNLLRLDGNVLFLCSLELGSLSLYFKSLMLYNVNQIDILSEIDILVTSKIYNIDIYFQSAPRHSVEA